MGAEITAILTSYARESNMPRIVHTIRQQTANPRVMLINNSGPSDFGVDDATLIRWNAGPVARWLFAPLVETEWVYMQDDDLVPKDKQFLEDMLEIAKQHPGGITGIVGRAFGIIPPYYRTRPDILNGSAAIVKNQCVMFRKNLLRHCAMPASKLDEDIHFSLEIGLGESVHWIDGGLRDRIERLPDQGAVSRSPGHWERREAACREWIARNG